MDVYFIVDVNISTFYIPLEFLLIRFTFYFRP